MFLTVFQIAVVVRFRAHRQEIIVGFLFRLAAIHVEVDRVIVDITQHIVQSGILIEGIDSVGGEVDTVNLCPPDIGELGADTQSLAAGQGADHWRESVDIVEGRVAVLHGGVGHTREEMIAQFKESDKILAEIEDKLKGGE